MARNGDSGASTDHHFAGHNSATLSSEQWNHLSVESKDFDTTTPNSNSGCGNSLIEHSHRSRQKANQNCAGSESPITDLEIISLVGASNPLPHYRLRVDPCTAFLGYKNNDFVGLKRRLRNICNNYPIPRFLTELTTIEDQVEVDEDGLSDEEHDDLGLTSEQIENTLDYFVLCGLRISQMTRTYEDLDAIAQLLEEKQTDLELAAKIGKTLLERNRELESQLGEREKRLAEFEDLVGQLRHDLKLKDSLLRILSKDSEAESDQHSETNFLSNDPMSLNYRQYADEMPLSSVNFNQLHRKLKDLEEENVSLRHERQTLNTAVDQLDEHETMLVKDCAHHLIMANAQIHKLTEELNAKSDTLLNQQSEISRLITRGLDMENRVKQIHRLNFENEMLLNRLKEFETTQTLLTSELKATRDKYDECLALYSEAKIELRVLRKRNRRYCPRMSLLSAGNANYVAAVNTLSRNANIFPSADPHHDIPSDDSTSSLDTSATQNNSEFASQIEPLSVASDLVQSARKQCAEENVERLFRAIDQARNVRILNQDSINKTQHNDSAIHNPQSESGFEDAVTSSGFVSGSEPLDNQRNTDHNEPVTNSHGVGDNQSFVKSYSYEDKYSSDLKRHSWLGYCTPQKGTNDYVSSSIGEFMEAETYFGGKHLDNYHLKQSILTSSPAALFAQSYQRFPQRLKLIKPLDGSGVLHHWQQLATPSLTKALFEAPTPGVKNRAGVNGTRASTPTPRLGDMSSSLAIPAENIARPPLSQFGHTLPSHLLGGRVRTRSLDQLVHPSNVSLNSEPHSFESHTTTNVAPFSFTSLVSALLPFNTHTTPTTTAAMSQPQTGTLSTEKVTRLSTRPRGLLDVETIDTNADKSLLQRVTVVGARSQHSHSDQVFTVPNPQPPQLICPPLNRNNLHPRSIARVTNLSEIVEEHSSPPKYWPETTDQDNKIVNKEKPS